MINDALTKQQDYLYVDAAKMYYHFRTGFYFDDVSLPFRAAVFRKRVIVSTIFSGHLSVFRSKIERVS